MTTYSFNWIRQHLRSTHEARLYAQDIAMLRVTSAIVRAMDEAGLDRTGLAKQVGRSKGHISQLLTGSRNMTVRTLADLLWACEREVVGVDHSPIGEARVPANTIDAWLDGGGIQQGLVTSEESVATSGVPPGEWQQVQVSASAVEVA